MEQFKWPGAAWFAVVILSSTVSCVATETNVCPVSEKICPTYMTCTADGLDCIDGTCGNGIVDTGEVCDDGNVRGDDDCSADCQEYTTCGNGVVDTFDDVVDMEDEACDDGNNISGDGCSADCSSDETCGNGVYDPQAGEACDDGNNMPGDGCSADCRLESCGDGILDTDAGEICDDGNTIEGDRCDANCRIEVMFAVGGNHTCALLDTGRVRCWGQGFLGQLGYGNPLDVGIEEFPSEVGDIDVGGTVFQITAGGSHTCALLDGGRVRCWGTGLRGRLGYGNIDDIGNDETPASVGDVDVGGIVTDVSAGFMHTCALLEGGAVRCWGEGDYGRLGYGNTDDIGDDETPASAGDVDLGGVAVQIAAANYHTCALLDSGAVRCWGLGNVGRLGYGNGIAIGDNETPSSAGDVDVGGPVSRVVVGDNHTCALLDVGSVRCWGDSEFGQLGHGNRVRIGDDEPPATAGDVSIGGAIGGGAYQLSAGAFHTCAIIDGGGVRCWGWNSYGQLGYGNTDDIGETELPSSVGEVSIGGTAVQIAVGRTHSCAFLASGALRCWGLGANGRLGYGNGGAENIGDDELPSSAGDVPYL